MPIFTPKYTFQQSSNGNVATRERPKIMTQIPRTPVYELEMLSPCQLPPQTPIGTISIHETTAQKLASLLQEVASIMDTITGEKMMCGEELDGLEGDVLGGLTEMVLIMEEEVEGLIELADAVEEYVEELELAESDGWVADLTPTLSNDKTHMEGISWESHESALQRWRGNIRSNALGDGKESIRIGLDDGAKGRISLGGLLEEVEEDVLGWGARELSVNSDNYGVGERSGVVIEAGISVPINNYRKGEVIKQTFISMSPGINDAYTKFRDSGLGLVSPAGVTIRSIKKEPRVTAKPTPIGLRTGLGSARRKKTIRKPQWV